MSEPGASMPRPYPPTATIVGGAAPLSGASQRTASSSATRKRSSTCALSVSAQALPVPPASSALRASARPLFQGLVEGGDRQAAKRRVVGVRLAQRGELVEQLRALHPSSGWVRGPRAAGSAFDRNGGDG